MKNRRSLIIVSLILSFTCMRAQGFLKDAFVGAPFNVIPSLSESVRLDMIDYFEHGMNRPSISYFGDEVSITELDSVKINVKLSLNTELDLYMMTSKNDTLLIAIHTYQIPVKESKVKVYDRTWNELAAIDAGYIADWILPAWNKKELKDEINSAAEFITAYATFDPDTKIISFKNTTEERLGREEFSKIQDKLSTERNFIFNGKNFKELKIK